MTDITGTHESGRCVTLYNPIRPTGMHAFPLKHYPEYVEDFFFVFADTRTDAIRKINLMKRRKVEVK